MPSHQGVSYPTIIPAWPSLSLTKKNLLCQLKFSPPSCMMISRSVPAAKHNKFWICNGVELVQWRFDPPPSPPSKFKLGFPLKGPLVGGIKSTKTILFQMLTARSNKRLRVVCGVFCEGTAAQSSGQNCCTPPTTHFQTEEKCPRKFTQNCQLQAKAHYFAIKI